jgi:thiol-disulfide isomerase/thioredoxin
LNWSRTALAAAASVTLCAAALPSGTTFDGHVFAIDRSPVTVVHYWAHWCAPCRVEMPRLDAWYRANRGRGVAVIAVSLDRNPSVAKKDMAGMEMPGTQIDRVKLARRDIPTALPRTLVYDRAGQLLYDSRANGHDGSIDFASLSRVTDAALRATTR